MGIRAVCPNGHRLHLKAQLAGRRGLCPDCGARFRIPTESSDVPQPFAEPPKRRAKSNESPSEVPMALPISQSVDIAHSVDAAALIEGDAIPSPSEASSPTFEMDDIVLDGPLAATATQSAAVGPAITPPVPANDPLSESPHALWYVQPPTGGRYGPAKPEIIRQWIAEGRITESCLVWRDGWSEWQSASTILSSSASGVDTTGGGLDEGVLPAGGTNLRHRRKGSKGLGVSMIVILALACVVLLVILVWLISSGRISL